MIIKIKKVKESVLFQKRVFNHCKTLTLLCMLIILLLTGWLLMVKSMEDKTKIHANINVLNFERKYIYICNIKEHNEKDVLAVTSGSLRPSLLFFTSNNEKYPRRCAVKFHFHVTVLFILV